MSTPYQEFAKKAKERFQKRQDQLANGGGNTDYVFTLHAQHKMRQYALSPQKVKSIIRNPRRREEGIVPDTIAVMQPPSTRKDASGKETWSQEIWVMYRLVGKKESEGYRFPDRTPLDAVVARKKSRIISAWRYPGVSPKRNPIPSEILREIEEEGIVEAEEIYW